MLYFMSDVRQVGALRLQFLDVLQRAFQPKMRVMRANAQAVKHQHFQITQALR